MNESAKTAKKKTRSQRYNVQRWEKKIENNKKGKNNF